VKFFARRGGRSQYFESPNEFGFCAQRIFRIEELSRRVSIAKIGTCRANQLRPARGPIPNRVTRK
jgi:hypothetical protein